MLSGFYCLLCGLIGILDIMIVWRQNGWKSSKENALLMAHRKEGGMEDTTCMLMHEYGADLTNDIERLTE